MADFCRGPHAVVGITRQVHLMDRMCERAGIPARAARKVDPGLWYEARLRCIGCAEGRRCAQFLASVRSTGQCDVPSFCANRIFFTEQKSNRAPRRVQ
jgi:uncharacterized protein DUF6455